MTFRYIRYVLRNYVHIYTQRMHSWRWIILSHSHMIYSLQTGKPHWRKKQWFEWIWHQPVEKCCTLDGWRPPSTVWQVLLFSVIAFLDLGIYYELTVLLGLVKGEAIKPASVSYHIYHEKKKRGDIPCLLRKSLPATGNNHGVWWYTVTLGITTKWHWKTRETKTTRRGPRLANLTQITWWIPWLMGNLTILLRCMRHFPAINIVLMGFVNVTCNWAASPCSWWIHHMQKCLFCAQNPTNPRTPF